MSDLFDIKGAKLDRGLENLKAARSLVEQELYETTQEM